MMHDASCPRNKARVPVLRCRRLVIAVILPTHISQDPKASVTDVQPRRRAGPHTGHQEQDHGRKCEEKWSNETTQYLPNPTPYRVSHKRTRESTSKTKWIVSAARPSISRLLRQPATMLRTHICVRWGEDRAHGDEKADCFQERHCAG